MIVSLTVVLPSFAAGGAERVTLSHLARIDRARIAPNLIVLDGRGPLRELLPADVPVHDLARPRLRRALPALIGALREARPDVVLGTMVHVNLALLAARPLLKGRPRLVLREANTPSRSLGATAHPRLMRTLYRRLMPRADAVLCNSRLMMDEIARDFALAPDRLVHLLNPVDVARLRTAASLTQREPGPGARFVASGRLERQKGFDRLIDMAASLSSDAHVTIFGDGPDGPALRAQADQSQFGARVSFAGFSNSPWDAVAGADAFLLPSRWEGMSNAALEALALGTPVIATPEAGGIGELAAAAAPGAVTLAEAGPPFVAAMASVVPRPADGLRPSLLPPGYEPDALAARLSEIVLEVAGSSRSGGSR
jgi:glycosyltransferase involved in cell wall biosynthesis